MSQLPPSPLFPYPTLFRSEFEETVCVIIKHTNPCGTATAATLKEAYVRALEADPVSAFGGVIGANRGHRLPSRSEEHTSELQSRFGIVCRLLIEKKNTRII